MTLPASGSISLSQVNVELSRSATASINMNESAVRTLFGKPSGTISMSDGRGKSNAVLKTVFFTSGTGSWTVPAGFQSLVSIEGIGAGTLAGGAYAKTTSVTGIAVGSVIYYSVGYIDSMGYDTLNTWARIGTNAQPTASSQGIFAQNAGGPSQPSSWDSTAPGLAANCIGTVTYSGGGITSTTYSGGGGAAGPNGAGKAGGGGSAGGGGGGGANGGYVGNTTTGTLGAAGGNGPSNTGGGAGGSNTGTTGSNGGAATAGTGGGGGGAGRGSSTGGTGGIGAMHNIWTRTSDGAVAGPAGGGGGGASGGRGTYGGVGQNYGGGKGAGGYNPVSVIAGGGGIVVITYWG